VTSAVYGIDLKEGLKNGLVSSIVSLGLADAQAKIGGIFQGDANGGEGSLGHVLLHGLAGCAAAELQGVDCTAGAAGGIAQAIYAGSLDPAALSSVDVVQRAKIIGAISGFITSRGEAGNVAVASAVASSGIVNNYLDHREAQELELARENLAECQTAENCDAQTLVNLNTTISEIEALDLQRNDDLRNACSADPNGSSCVQHVTDALISVGYYIPLESSFLDSGESYRFYERYAEGGEHPRADFIEAVLGHQRDTLSFLSDYSVSVAHTESLLADQQLAVVAGVGVAATAGARLIAACMVNPACRLGVTITETLDCAISGDPTCLAPGPSAAHRTVDGIWDQGRFTPIQRGNTIEDYLAGTDYNDWTRVGSQNNGFSPAWDFNQGSTWVSLKTVDTNGSGWQTSMRSHIRELETWSSPTNPNAAKVLDIRVQPGGAISAQSLIDYGASRGVHVRINDF
jgi:hypothetical protein